MINTITDKALVMHYNVRWVEMLVQEHKCTVAEAIRFLGVRYPVEIHDNNFNKLEVGTMDTLFDKAHSVSIVLRAPKTKRSKQPDIKDISSHLGVNLVETGDYTYDAEICFNSASELKTFIRKALDHKEVAEYIFKDKDGHMLYFIEEPK